MDLRHDRLGAGVAVVGERLRQLERGGIVALLEHGIDGLEARLRGADAHPRQEVADLVLQRLAVDPERKAKSHEHDGDDRHHLEPDPGPALGHAFALVERRPQGGDLLFQRLFLRPVPVQRKARQQ